MSMPMPQIVADKAVSLFRTGMRIDAIAKELGWGRTTIRKSVKKSVSKQEYKTLTRRVNSTSIKPDEGKEMVRLYRETEMTTAEISETVGYTSRAVSSYLRRTIPTGDYKKLVAIRQANGRKKIDYTAAFNIVSDEELKQSLDDFRENQPKVWACECGHEQPEHKPFTDCPKCFCGTGQLVPKPDLSSLEVPA